MARLVALHPAQLTALASTATFATAFATHDFWTVLAVGVAFLPPLRRSARRHAR